MCKKILLTLGGKAHNHNTLEFALTFARQLGAALEVSRAPETVAEDSSQALLETVTRKAKERGVCVRVQNQHHYPQALADVSADCIVVSRELYSLRLHSSPHTFIVIPEGETWQAPKRLSRLLFSLEDDPVNFETLEQASVLAARLNAALSVVYVLELPPVPPKGARAWMYVNRQQVVEEFEARREKLRHQSKDMVFKARHILPEVVPEVIETKTGGRVGVLAEVARKQKADLLIMESSQGTLVDTLLERNAIRNLARDLPVAVISRQQPGQHTA